MEELKWNFGEGSTLESPQNAAIKEFSKNIIESIVREAIQNSLDNSIDKPVKVNFEFGTINLQNIPCFDDLIMHYEASKIFWKTNESYQSIFNDIDNELKYFKQTRSIPYLKISDYNTTGMNLESIDANNKYLSNYWAFTRGNNTIKSEGDTGGSEGQGKATFYAASPLRTIFLHTVSEKGSIYEGLCKLSAHEINEKIYSANGHLFQMIDKPQYEDPNNLNINLPFRRSEINKNYGTSITILGLWTSDDLESKMMISAINNFWMAIEEGDLEIKINNLTINITLNKDTLNDYIDKYLPERNESSHAKGNPTKFGKTKCYYETWNNEILSNNREIYFEKLDLLGDCTLKIKQHEEYPGKVAFFRKQKMLINKSSIGAYISKGYCGVFLCSSEKGNKILRSMEGKTHTEWDPKLCTTNKSRSIAEEAIKELNQFIKNCWNDYQFKYMPETFDLKGLEGITIKNKQQARENRLKKEDKEKRDKKKNTDRETNKDRITQKSLRSYKDGNNDIWKYILTLHSEEVKIVHIKMTPTTDSITNSRENILVVKPVTENWEANTNSLTGKLESGSNEITFVLEAKERIGLKFNITTYEI